MAKSLVVYYSRPGQNYFGGAIKSVAVGNTKVAAQVVAEQAGADQFEVIPADPYPDDYAACVERSRAELAADARPAVESLPDVSAYDVIYLGYPNWCGTIPMCVATVLGSLDLAGKVLRPFCTNEGSGMGASEADVRRLVPGATVEPGLSIRGSEAAQCGPQVAAWIG